MHLLQVRDKIAQIQTSHGDIKLSRVVLIDDKDVTHLDYSGDASGRPSPPLMTIAEAETTGSLEERLAAAGPDGFVTLQSAELEQLLEYKAELMEAYDTGRNKTGEQVPPVTAAELAAAEKEFTVHLQKGPQMVPDLEGKGKEVRMPCPQWDGKKHPCVLPYGHEGDHQFTSCPQVNVTMGACKLAAGHYSDHVWENPGAKPDAVTQEVERELEAKKPAEG